MTESAENNDQLERGLDAASVQSAGQHGKQMTGIEDIEATQELHSKALQHGEDRMDSIEALIKINNAATEEVLEILRLGKAFFKLAGYFGVVVKWGLGIAVPVLAFWYTLKGGK